MKRWLLFLWIALFACVTSNLFGQYYDWGQEPFSIRWQRIKTPWNSFVFPEGYAAHSVRTMHYFDTIRPWIGYGFSRGPMKRMPVLMHTQNYVSNGLVLLAPKRMEFIVTPSPSIAAMPWLKQLAAHEYRHAVQYNNLNRGVIKALSYLLGEQGSLVGALYLPYWLMEGDAVMAETQMSSFGRGLQPSFTIEYRAMALEGTKRYAIDKYFCGSYKDYMPDHYQLGYQIASYAYTKYGRNIWDDVARFGSSYPFLFCTTKLALNKYYRTSVNRLFRETFADLNRFWRTLPQIDNSASLISTPVTSYTSYSWPVLVNDSTVYALKSDLDRYSRLVRVDPRTGEETVLRYTGYVSSGLDYDGEKLRWTEYRQSTCWEQRVHSQVCSYDLRDGKMETVRGDRTSTWPVSLPNGEVAVVEYAYDGTYAICSDQWRYVLPDTISVHGLAYDDRTARLYFIGLSDEGMWIGGVDPGGHDFTMVKPASYATLANLRAGGGKLYYNSIATGKDEAHLYDLVSATEYRITDSRYGSFSPAPAGDGERVVLTTYTPEGYMLATQKIVPDSLVPVPYAEIPTNLVNPPRVKWEVPNLDKIRVADTTTLPVRRYRKGLHLFNFHSWAPFDFDPNNLVDENRFNVQAGATLLSQNLLNSTVTQLRYGYANGESIVRAGIQYNALAPKFDVTAEWSTVRQAVYGPDSISVNGKVYPLDPGARHSYFDIQASASLPLLLSSGYHIKRLTPSVAFEHTNARMFNFSKYRFFTGLQKMTFSLQYSDNVRAASRDLLPRWGYAAGFLMALNPFCAGYGELSGVWVRGYLPGVAQHHSLTLRLAGQYQRPSNYNFQQKLFFPRGVNYGVTAERYGAVSADYQLPLCYPDGGIPSILYFKRIRANVYGDYARYRTIYGTPGEAWSYGVDLIFDVAPIRLPASTNTSVSISIYKPSDRRGVVVGTQLSLPI